MTAQHAPLVVDTHNHYWVYGASDLYWLEGLGPAYDLMRRTYLPSDLKPHMDAVGVQRSVIVQAAHAWRDQLEYLDWCTQYPYVAAVIAWIDLTAPDAGDKLDRLIENPSFRGVRAGAEDQPDPGWLLRDDVRRGIREVTKRGLCLDLLARTPHLGAVARIAAENDGAKLILDHLAKPPLASADLSGWRRGVLALKPYRHLRLKISGLLTETRGEPTTARIQPAVDTVLDNFGVERLIWGSDWPVALLAASYEDSFHRTTAALARLSATERAAVLGGNAQAFYGVNGG
ncbi:MAG: amidohydrolase family protein, partial [Actinobacteria bacterium]|nr:amidohydrolase family protein [Actinomycetota bacterium]